MLRACAGHDCVGSDVARPFRMELRCVIGKGLFDACDNGKGPILDLDQRNEIFGLPFEKLFFMLSPGGSSALFDSTKFSWIGSMTQTVFVTVTWHSTPIKTLRWMPPGAGSQHPTLSNPVNGYD